MSEFPWRSQVICEPLITSDDEPTRQLKSLAKCYVADDHHIEMHFNAELPILPRVTIAKGECYPATLDRTDDIDDSVGWMVRVNTGRLPDERVDSETVYRDFLSELVFIEGIEAAIGHQRYSIRIHVGIFFDLQIVAEAVARCIHRHLFPSTQLRFRLETIPVFNKACRTAEELAERHRDKQDDDEAPF